MQDSWAALVSISGTAVRSLGCRNADRTRWDECADPADGLEQLGRLWFRH